MDLYKDDLQYCFADEQGVDHLAEEILMAGKRDILYYKWSEDHKVYKCQIEEVNGELTSSFALIFDLFGISVARTKTQQNGEV